MPYEVKFDAASAIVHVIYLGKASLSERVQAVKEVCRSYIQMRPLKILVNVRELEMDLTHEQQISFGEYLASNQVLSDARVAVLHLPSHNPNFLIDATAFNYGYKLAQFNSIKDAQSWLTDK